MPLRVVVSKVMMSEVSELAVKKILCPPPKNQFTGDRTDL